MSPITITGFFGAVLALDDINVSERSGVASQNQRLGFGDLRPWAQPGVSVATLPAGRLTMHRMGQDVASDSNYWLAWGTRVSVTRGFESSDPTERIYFTGSGTPKWTDNTKALTGGPPYPQATRELSMPAPTGALVASIVSNGTTGDDVGTSYFYTYVNELGWESAPSPVSNDVLIKPGATVQLIGFAAPPAGTYGITLVRLYKAVTGDSGETEYFLLREWAVGAEPANPIDDARAVGTLTLGTVGWVPPPADAHSIRRWWNGMLCVLSGKSARPCVPNVPYAYPSRYAINATDTMVAQAVFGQRALLLTTGDPVLVAGADPESLDDEPTGLNQACVSAAGVVEFNEGGFDTSLVKGAAWPSPNGLCWYGEDGYRLLTDGMFTKEQWQALHPETMVAVGYQGLYIAFYDDGAGLKGIVIDPRNPAGASFLTTGYTAAFKDRISGALYVLDGVNVRKWDAGAAMTALFRSKTFLFPAPVNIGAVEVVAKGGPVTIRLYANGVLWHQQTLTAGSGIVRPPSGKCSDRWALEVSSAQRVISLRMATDIDDLQQA